MEQKRRTPLVPSRGFLIQNAKKRYGNDGMATPETQTLPDAIGYLRLPEDTLDLIRNGGEHISVSLYIDVRENGKKVMNLSCRTEPDFVVPGDGEDE